ncbi:LamG-like jellyroll fold domain-containing protein [Streptomyces griseorubiginosus]|uniref:LamG-like jellyroll fold domain-containing protein n=1 Tax=Streptomyces griseorubiginosus TaxID=67304 RepID=UPI002E81EBDB|nr:LamG-like jellyroll fold domain-containing protein [Streptomyces griseorubiginosus]WUB47527.1 alpha-L-arabinofuranosidase [Streptomyces griseorubiginosus]WUB56052.1 alpha-L-arabinofuranosidase [Streptomyces griseorubiginosus]
MPSETGPSRRTVLTAIGVASLAGTFAGSTPAMAAPAAEASPVTLPAASAHWTFDEGTGTTAADASGNGETATLQGAAGWGDGKVGAHSLNLTAGGNATASGPVVDTSKAFSVSAWVNLAQLGGYQTAVSIDGKVVSAFYLGLRDDTGTFAFARLASDATQGAAVAAAASAPIVGTWTHLVGVSDAAAGVTRLYVNGVLEGETAYAAGWAGTGATAIGRALYGGGQVDQFHGQIDDVQLFPTALTSDQVATLAGVPVESTTPLLSVDVSNPAHAVSPILPGLMFEDINHSGEGGIYAELVQNRSMMASDTDPVHWSAVGGTTLSLDTSTPLNEALNRSLKVVLPSGTGVGSRAGVSNDGFWGIPVRPRTTYTARLFAKASRRMGPLTVSIESADGGTVYASARVSHIGTTFPDRPYELTLRTGAGAPVTGDARLTVTTSDAAASGETLWLQHVSLFPPTYNNRPNGLRVDLMEKLIALKPKFLRFPGGNFLEGNTIATRFNWKNTIGPVWERPGHMDDAWGYWSTDGLGLMEYLHWVEDMKAQPVLAVFAGYTLKGDHVTGDALQPFVQDALDEIEYVTGPVTSKWGARRAADGHPKPFPLEYVEIGNEDWFDGSGSYDARFTAFHDAIKAKYPHLKLIATTTVTSRTPDLMDEHYYLAPSAAQAATHKYDNRDRASTKVFVGEWAAQEGRPTPDLNAALGDASWLAGLIRNSDQVLMECYAPLFSNVNNNVWATNLIAYDNLTSYVSPSYWAQQMLTSKLGEMVLPATARALPGLATVVTRTGKHVYLAVVNYGTEKLDVPVELEGLARGVRKSAKATVLTGPSPTATNTLTEPTTLVPRTTTVSGAGQTFTTTLPPLSVTVLELTLT